MMVYAIVLYKFSFSDYEKYRNFVSRLFSTKLNEYFAISLVKLRGKANVTPIHIACMKIIF